LDTVQALKARSFEAREGRQFLEAAMRAQRERLRELTQENDRLRLQVAIQADGLDVCDFPTCWCEQCADDQAET
jgi:hypothetical protein